MIKHVYSFGFGWSERPKVDAIFDARRFRNPHSNHFLRGLDGTHPEVRDYVLSSPGVEEFIQSIMNQDLEFVAVGCYGGKHRSVAIAEEIARRAGATVTHLHKGRRS